MSNSFITLRRNPDAKADDEAIKRESAAKRAAAKEEAEKRKAKATPPPMRVTLHG